jgi:phage terminase large subunit GpA-like protein
MKTTISTQCFKVTSSDGKRPHYYSKCPHCGLVQSIQHNRDITIFGPADSQVVTCDWHYKESDYSSVMVRGGCGRRYVADLRIDAIVTSTPLEDE